MNDIRLLVSGLLIVNAVGVYYGIEALDHDISFSNESTQPTSVFLAGRVCDDGLLTPVPYREDGSASQGIALGPLDFDHVRALVGEQHTQYGDRRLVSKFHYLIPGKRACQVFTSARDSTIL